MLTIGLGDTLLQILKQCIRLSLAFRHGREVVGEGALCADGFARSVNAYGSLVFAATQLVQPRAELTKALG